MNEELHEEYERVKAVSEPREVARDLGLELRRKGKGWMTRCPNPAHEDKKPSCSITEVGFHCFGCGAKGDVVDLVCLVLGKSRAEAKRWLEERSGIASSNGAGRNGTGGPAKEGEKEKEKEKGEASADEIEILRAAPSTWKLLTDLTGYFHGRLPESPEALEYLSMRGLYSPEVVRHFKVGYDDGSAANALSAEQRSVLAKISYLNGRGKSAFYKMIIVPLLAGDLVVGLYGRRIGDVEPVQRYLAGRHRGLVNPQAIHSSSELVLAESPLDALSAFAMGVPHVTTTYGAMGFTPELVEAIEKTTKILYLAQDADPAGDSGAAKAANLFLKKGIVCRRVRLPKGTKDLNELLTGYGERRSREVFGRVLEEAPPLSAAGAVAGSSSYEGMLSFREGQGQFHYGGVHYVVWPIPLSAMNPEAMSLAVKASKNGVEHSDRLNIYVSRSRSAFAAKVSERMGVQPARISDDLERIRAEIEALWARSARPGPSVSGPEAAGAMSPADREEALGLLRDPKLLARIISDLELLGYVGEPVNKVLTYLVSISRKMEQPLGAVIRSSSSSGKSRLMGKVADLCPPEEVELLSRITPKGLYHLPDDYLSGRLLILDESAGANEDVEYCIRQILSRRELSAAIVQANPATGMLETLVFKKEARSAYMEATTAVDGKNVENENRVFVIALDESQEQTARIHEAQKKAYQKEEWEHSGRIEGIVAVHRNAQRLLRPMRIEIPFVEKIRFPTHWPRTRRDHERFLALVAVGAFLHQYQRRVAADGTGALYAVATVEDYRVAYHIARQVMAEGLQELSKAHQELMEHVQRMVCEKAKATGTREEDYQFTRADIREWTGWPHYRVRNLVVRLEELEILQVVVGGRGRSTQYRLGQGLWKKGSDPLEGLTKPEEL